MEGSPIVKSVKRREMPKNTNKDKGKYTMHVLWQSGGWEELASYEHLKDAWKDRRNFLTGKEFITRRYVRPVNFLFNKVDTTMYATSHIVKILINEN